MKKIYSSAALHVINMHATDIITSSPQSFSVRVEDLDGKSISGFKRGQEIDDANDQDIIW